MNNFFERISSKFKNYSDLQNAENSLALDSDNLELQIEIIRAYLFLYSDRIVLNSICESVIWIIRNRPDAEREFWYETSSLFLNSGRESDVVNVWQEALDSNKFQRNVVLENAAIFTEIIDVKFCIECRKNLYYEDKLDLNKKFNYAKILISPSHLRSSMSVQPKIAMPLFEELLSTIDDSSIETITAACRCALLCKNKQNLESWIDAFIRKIPTKSSELTQLYINEAQGILARTSLFLGRQNVFLEALNYLKRTPIKLSSDLLLFDRELIEDMKKANMSVSEYIEKRFSFADSNLELKNEYLNLL